MKTVFLVAGLVCALIASIVWFWQGGSAWIALPEALVRPTSFLVLFFGAILLFLAAVVDPKRNASPVPELELKRIDNARIAKRADVVFIHGLGGNAQSTWSFDGSSSGFWPAWLAAEFPELAVWTLQYQTSTLKWSKFSLTIEQRAHTICELLLGVKEQGPTSRPLYFVAHSMGGIFVKQMLRKGSESRFYRDILDRTSGIIFIGTPHKGSYLATYLKALNVANLLRINNDVKELTAGEPWLKALDLWFGSYAVARGTQFVKCFYEGKPLRIWFVRTLFVVPEEFAVPELPKEICDPVPVGADHIEICKPVSRTDPLYLSISRFIQENMSDTKQSANRFDGSVALASDSQHELPAP